MTRQREGCNGRGGRGRWVFVMGRVGPGGGCLARFSAVVGAMVKWQSPGLTSIKAPAGLMSTPRSTKSPYRPLYGPLSVRVGSFENSGQRAGHSSLFFFLCASTSTFGSFRPRVGKAAKKGPRNAQGSSLTCQPGLRLVLLMLAARARGTSVAHFGRGSVIDGTRRARRSSKNNSATHAHTHTHTHSEEDHRGCYGKQPGPAPGGSARRSENLQGGVQRLRITAIRAGLSKDWAI